VRRSPLSAALELRARLGAQRRDSRAVVLRWSRVVVTEEEVAMEVLEGRSSKGAGRGGLGSVKRGC
jgi:hypothetical protein